LKFAPFVLPDFTEKYFCATDALATGKGYGRPIRMFTSSTLVNCG